MTLEAQAIKEKIDDETTYIKPQNFSWSKDTIKAIEDNSCTSYTWSGINGYKVCKQYI